jgi:uncharacterized membrane protein
MALRKNHDRRRSDAAAVARGLGWFSIGLGAAQILAPRAVARVTGLPFPPAFVMLCGLRELACGVGILSESNVSAWMKARVVGDALDLAALGAAWARGGEPNRLALSAAAAAGVTALDTYCSRELDRPLQTPPRHIRATIGVNRPREQLYAFWRELPNLPRVMPHLQSVTPLEGNRSHWVAEGPAGATVEWDSEIIDDRPNERLAWRSVDGSDIYNAGSVSFENAPAGRGTYVRVELLYEPPAGTLGASVAKLFGRDAGQEVRADLRAFKQLMETGEIATTKGQPSGRPGPRTYDQLARIAT